MSKTFCVILHISYMLLVIQKVFCQFISNHFDLENSFKMTPTRRSFLYALFFICFSCSQVSTYLHSLGDIRRARIKRTRARDKGRQTMFSLASRLGGLRDEPKARLHRRLCSPDPITFPSILNDCHEVYKTHGESYFQLLFLHVVLS